MKNNFMIFDKNGKEILVNLKNVVKIEKSGDGCKVTYNYTIHDCNNYEYFDDDFNFIKGLMEHQV